MKTLFAAIFSVILFAVNTASAEVQINRAELIQRALDVQANAYAPYSKFNVAAAVLCSSGKIYTGVNVENVDYPAGINAAELAVFTAVAAGERQIVALATVGGANGVNTEYISPSGICRQVMREFAAPEKCLIIMAKSPTEYVEKTLAELFPMSLTPGNLQ